MYLIRMIAAVKANVIVLIRHFGRDGAGDLHHQAQLFGCERLGHIGGIPAQHIGEGIFGHF